MSKTNDGGAAFPRIKNVISDRRADGKVVDRVEGADGMTLRDHFAGQALVSLGTWMPSYSNGKLDHPETMAQRALLAYQQADAMLKVREA